MIELRSNYATVVNELDQIGAILVELVDQMSEHNSGPYAPGHCHTVPGIWDSDNGILAGQPCALCAIWRKAETMSRNHYSNTTT